MAGFGFAWMGVFLMGFTRDDTESYTADVATAAGDEGSPSRKSPSNLFGFLPLVSSGARFNRLSFVRSGYDVVRIVAAIILLAAAGMKTHQLATEPIFGTSILDSRWLLMTTVEFELFFGLWLMSNILPRATWMAAIGLFGLFTCVSLYKALSGAASCGCFGRVEVNPWYTALLDLSIVVSLIRWRPRRLPSPDCGRGAGGEGISVSFARFTTIAVLWLAIGFPAGYAMGSYTDTTLSDAGEVIGDGEIVVLKPEGWIGKQFPLFDYVDLGNKLKEKEWLVVLYHHDCPNCQQTLLRLSQQAAITSRSSQFTQIAIIELPPYGLLHMPSFPPSLHQVRGHLTNTKESFSATPCILQLNDGVVVQSKDSSRSEHGD